MKSPASAIFLAALLFFSAVAPAQMRPGAKVEKTYSLGLPRDMDKLLFSASEYPDYPLKPGQEAYKDIDGYRIKDRIRKFTAISLRSLDDGEQYWGRITGTKYDRMTNELIAEEFTKLGLKVTRQPFTVPELWYPTHWEGSYTAAGQTSRLQTLFPINETQPTPAAGITVWRRGRTRPRRPRPQRQGRSSSPVEAATPPATAPAFSILIRSLPKLAPPRSSM